MVSDGGTQHVAKGLHYAAKRILVDSAEIRRIGRIALDVLASGAGFAVAVVLQGGSLELKSEEIFSSSLVVFSAICGVVYFLTGLSFRSWRFVSMQDMFLMARDVAIAVGCFMLMDYFLDSHFLISRSTPVIAYFVTLIALGGMRATYRHVSEQHRLPFGLADGLEGRLSRGEATNLLVYGATIDTDAFCRSLQTKPGRRYQVLGIIEDEGAHRDRRVRGVKILGDTGDLEEIVRTFSESGISVAHLVVPVGSLPPKKLRLLVDAAARAGLKVVRLPGGHELLKRSGDTFDFEPIAVTDLLARDPVALQLEAIGELINGKSVVVTGGAGSIGSELCRRLLARGPSKLVIVDHCEFSLFNIGRELAKADRDGAVQTVLASVRDKDRIQSIFSEARVDLVFHAAAYKHVPLVERNALEGILTNVIGTCNVADAAVEVGAAAMIMVSTDKAVKPRSTMGLTKRVAEIYCQALDVHCARRGLPTRYMAVRFGNVLGSSGSVIPIFEEQIRRGGPITVTDLNMTRYFMTIPEAVELVLQATVYGLGDRASLGGILVLDMGEPVKILELAHRMITLAGFVPGRDIPIEIVGVRDGEKLHEELFDVDEVQEATDMPSVRLALSRARCIERMRALRDLIIAAGASEDVNKVLSMLHDVLRDESGEEAAPRFPQWADGPKTLAFN